MTRRVEPVTGPELSIADDGSLRARWSAART
jgi:hypothetical protein